MGKIRKCTVEGWGSRVGVGGFGGRGLEGLQVMDLDFEGGGLGLLG